MTPVLRKEYTEYGGMPDLGHRTEDLKHAALYRVEGGGGDDLFMELMLSSRTGSRISEYERASLHSSLDR